MRISDWSSYVCSSDLQYQRTAHRITSPWKWRHLKSVIVPSVQSLPSMLKLHDFCNRARYSIGVGVTGFELDFWGRVRNLSDAARSQYLATVQRSEEHTSELQSLMRISYAVFCLKKKKQKHLRTTQPYDRY